MKIPFLRSLLLMVFLAGGQMNVSAQLPAYVADVYDSVGSRGYYFIFTYRMKQAREGQHGTQFIIDGNGRTVYYRRSEAASDFKVHPDGRMSYFCRGKFMLTDSTFRIIDSVGCVNGVETDPHDFLILPNGHYLLIGAESEPADLSTYHLFLKKKMPGSKKGKLKTDVIQELDARQHLVFQWNAEKCYQPADVNPVYLNDTMVLSYPHLNSIAVDPDGNIVASVRYCDEVIKINRNNGALLWRLGGARNQFRFINDSLRFCGQHDAHYLPNGHLLLFDNGYSWDSLRHGARAVEYELNEKRKTAKLVWSYTYSPQLISDATGNARRMANGNTLVNFGRITNVSHNVMFVVAAPDGKLSLLLAFRDTCGSYRAYQYDRLPFQLHRPQVTVEKIGKQFLLTAETGHPAYQWSTGDSTRALLIRKPGDYAVFVPYGDGGMLSSVNVHITAEMLKEE